MFLSQLIPVLCVILVGQISCQHEDYFLPKNVIPIRYTITIITHNVSTYTGNVDIELEAIEDTSNITLHIKNIEIDENNVRVIDENNTEVKWSNTNIDADKEFYIINLKKNLYKGKSYNLSISEYRGSLTEIKSGFFGAKYRDGKGTETTFAVTDFEPTSARKAFPCFDEPNLKAKFNLRIVRPLWMNSASNTPIQETIDLKNGNCLDIFKETPPMSTYIVAFIVSNFEYTKQNNIIRVLVQPEHANDGSTDFILEESAKVLQALEEYTGIKYPLEKLDLVAIPEHYFVDGAMENWGLITYSDKHLICPKNYGYRKLQSCLTFSAHEIAHQWFGNLATQKTWHYIWLSEGYASYFQYYIADIVKPSWRIKDQYFIEEYQVSLKTGYNLFTEAIDFEFTSSESFPNSNVYYKKASAIIRMTEHILTDEIHRNGLRLYLDNNKYKNTEPKDVYDAYEQALKNANATYLLGNLTIHEILSTWTKNPSYPLVTVKRDYETGKTTFSQKPFGNVEESDLHMLWYIPITYTLENDASFMTTTTDVWLTDEHTTINIDTNDGWILINKNATGYYRVAYDETNWGRITAFLKTKNYTIIPPLNRAQLLYDAYFFAAENKLSYEVFFNLSTYLEQEIDYIPITAFLDILDEVGVWRAQNITYHTPKMYITKLLGGISAHLKLNKIQHDSHIDRLCRNSVQRILCKVAQEDCVNEALHTFKEWRETGKLDLDSHLQKNWLCAAMKNASRVSWDFLLRNYYSAKDNQTKAIYTYALACVENPVLLQRFVEEIFSLNNTMFITHRSVGLSQLLESQLGTDIFINYIQTIEFSESECSYFSELESMFKAALSSQIQKIQRILKKTKECVPVSFYELETSVFVEELNVWYHKYLL